MPVWLCHHARHGSPGTWSTWPTVRVCLLVSVCAEAQLATEEEYDDVCGAEWCPDFPGGSWNCILVVTASAYTLSVLLLCQTQMSHHEVTLTIHIHYTGRDVLDPYALTDPPISVNLYPWCCYTPCFILKPRPGSEGRDPTSWKKSMIGQIQRYDGTHFSKKSNIQHMQKHESIPFAKKKYDSAYTKVWEYTFFKKKK